MADFPDWGRFTPEQAAAELPRLLAASEASVAALEASAPTTYEGLVDALDDATRDLYRTWGQVTHLTSVMNADAWRAVEEGFQPQLVAFSLRVGQSRPIYRAAKAILSEAEGLGLTPVRRRILAKMVEAAELAGVGLDGAQRARFNAIQAALAKLGMDFSNAVLDATKAFSFEKDGKTYTIDDANYPETMKHCADRAVREALCRARATRAPENAARVDEILKLRAELAALLGFASYADLSLATKCAPSVAAAFKMIDDLDAATAAPAAAEDQELRASAPAEIPSVEPWDVAFCAERLRERKYAYSEEELKRHFELEDVLRGLFRISNLLFGIDVEEVTGDAKPSVWHPDVRFFAVKEKGETIAHFYFDPFVRNGLKNGGAWMNEFRNLRKREGGRVELPLALVCTNFPVRDGEGKCHLPFREVETLFHEFGHALQCMLTRVEEEDAAGINLVEWDAVEVASQFMENWCLDDRTGIAVPDELKAKVRAAKNFRAASACRRQLAFAKTDLLLHRAWGQAPEGEDANCVKSDVFAHFGVPAVVGDRFLCSFSHIFAGGYAAGYYGYKWAEVFRAFRGRDPEIAALLRQQGIVGA